MWYKTLKHSFVTDFNIDKQSHVLLYLLQKEGVLAEYILSLIEQDIKAHQLELNDVNQSGLVALQEMGYNVSSPLNSVKEWLSALQDLPKNAEERQEKFSLLNLDCPLTEQKGLNTRATIFDELEKIAQGFNTYEDFNDWVTRFKAFCDPSLNKEDSESLKGEPSPKQEEEKSVKEEVIVEVKESHLVALDKMFG